MLSAKAFTELPGIAGGVGIQKRKDTRMATPHKDNKIRSAHYQIKGWDMS